MYIRVNINRHLPCQADRVWEVLKDFGGHYQFNPLIKMSPVTNGVPEGLGAEREVTLYDGSHMQQTILDYVEGKSMLIGFTETSLPIVTGTALFNIETLDRHNCALQVEVTIEPKYGLLGGLVGQILRPVIRYRYNLVTRGLGRFVGTQTPATTSSVEAAGCNQGV